MKKKILIRGRSYDVGCAAGEEARLQRCCQLVDSVMQDLARQLDEKGKSISESSLAVMTAITLADKMVDMEEKASGVTPAMREGASGDWVAKLEELLEKLSGRLASLEKSLDELPLLLADLLAEKYQEKSVAPVS